MKIERIQEAEHVWKIILSDGGETDISHLWLFDHQMRFGSARLKMGGIGGVFTRETHRKRGYSRCVMEDSTRFMEAHGFDVAMLFGISNFYPKFGYATVLPEPRLTFVPADAVEARASYCVRRFDLADAPQVLEIYEMNNAERPGTLVRPPERWKGFKMGSSFRERALPYVVVGETDEVLGYFVCDDTDKHCTMADIGFRDRSIFETIAWFLVDRANELKVEEIACSLPPDHPFAIFCRRYGCRTSIRDAKNGGCMMRIIDQTATLEKICGELSRRLQRSAAFSDWTGRVQICTDLGETCLGIDRGFFTIAEPDDQALHFEIPQAKLIQLMMGRRCIEDLTADGDVVVDADLIQVLGVLFPLGYSHVWWPDRF